jgi:hypothetical protein
MRIVAARTRQTIQPTAMMLNSSNLSSADYDPWSGTLTIAFHGGRVYLYHHVPPSEYSGLVNASSHGRYFHQYIKDHYDYQRLA